MRFFFSGKKKEFRGHLLYSGDDFNKAQITFLKKEQDSYELKNIEQYSDEDIGIFFFKSLSDTESIMRYGKENNISSFLLDDIVNINQRPKAQFGEGHLFLSLRRLIVSNDSVTFSPISIYYDTKRITFFVNNENDDLITNFINRINNNRSPFRTSDIIYSIPLILDIITSEYLNALDVISIESQDAEIKVLDQEDDVDPKDIFFLKKKIYDMRKIIRPSKEALYSIIRSDEKMIGKSEKNYFYEIYENITQTLEHLEVYADNIRSIYELQLTINGNRLNEIMKTLSVIGTIFIPLTFIAGIYGMNFEFMPELGFKYGYPVAVVVMIVIALFLLAWFKKRKWI